MSKQLGQTPRELGKHRYRASKGIQPPRVRYLLDAQTLDKAAQELVSLIEQHGGVAKYTLRARWTVKAPRTDGLAPGKRNAATAYATAFKLAASPTVGKQKSRLL